MTDTYKLKNKHEIVWSDDFIVGNEKIDNQHKTIISLINLLFNKDFSSHQCSLILPQIADNMKQHLIDEEQFLIGIGYPLLSDHKNAHDKFLILLDDFLSEEKKDESKIFKETKIFFEIWWKELLLEDMKYKDFIKNKLNA